MDPATAYAAQYQQMRNAEHQRRVESLMGQYQQARQGMNPLVMGVLAGGVAGLGSDPQGTAKHPQQKQADVFGDMLDAGLYNGQRSTWQADRIEQLEARIADLEARIWDE